MTSGDRRRRSAVGTEAEHDRDPRRAHPGDAGQRRRPAHDHVVPRDLRGAALAQLRQRASGPAADARHAAGHRRRRAPRAPAPRSGAVHAGGDRAVRAGDPRTLSSTGSSPSAATPSPRGDVPRRPGRARAVLAHPDRRPHQWRRRRRRRRVGGASARADRGPRRRVRQGERGATSPDRARRRRPPQRCSRRSCSPRRWPAARRSWPTSPAGAAIGTSCRGTC